MAKSAGTNGRTKVFISKATPGDDDFVLWLAPKLEAEGYSVVADILFLEGGSKWRKELTVALQDSAAKMLLCCSDRTLSRNGVQEEIAIAEDLSRELGDERFIIPLRLEPFKKVIGIGGSQYIDFASGWAGGLDRLLGTMRRQKVPKVNSAGVINNAWASYRKKMQVQVERVPETLTTNWLRIASIPDTIFFYTPLGSVPVSALVARARSFPFACYPHQNGFITFAAPLDVNEHFADYGRLRAAGEVVTKEFLANGSKALALRHQEAKNIVVFILRRSWEQYALKLGLLEHRYSSQSAFYAGPQQAGLGKRIPWGRQGQRRSSMLRNVAKGRVWQYGITAIPSLWPFPHLRLKGRVLFSDLINQEAGPIYDDPRKQHSLRRSVCAAWRNKAWHGRLMALLEVVADGRGAIFLPVGSTRFIELDEAPIQVTSPVTAAAPDTDVEGDEHDENEDALPTSQPEPGK